MNICFLDNFELPYNSYDLNSNKIRGAENIIINLSRELSILGHKVTVFNNVEDDKIIENVKWSNINKLNQKDLDYDVAFTNNDIGLFKKINSKKKIAFSHSLQTIEKFIRKKQLLPYLKYKPKIVLLSNYHKNNRNIFLKMFGSIRLDWSVDHLFINTKINNDNKDNIAIFTSRPDRNLNLLIDIWKKYIFTKKNKYKLLITPNNENLEEFNIFHRKFDNKQNMINDLLSSKIFLVPGHKSELFCIAAEEARELCIPIVTLGIGALSERVEHGITGFVAKNDKEFSNYTIDLFNDQSLWNEIRNNLIKKRGRNSWNKTAINLIKLI